MKDYTEKAFDQIPNTVNEYIAEQLNTELDKQPKA